MKSIALALILASAFEFASTRANLRDSRCLGEFVRCPLAGPGNGECVVDVQLCGNCPSANMSSYLCPLDGKTCVVGFNALLSCPGFKGSHYDSTLSEDERLDYLVSKTSLDEKIQQLQNTAPAILSLGIPAYQWLNDDQHGVARTPANATVFPNGVGLGATWSKETISLVGGVVGREARGLHNGFLASDPQRSMSCNGCSITAYAPNLNLAHDPRWGRTQEVYTEDPHLMSELVVQFVTGVQNNSAGSSLGPGGNNQAAACCKHFAVYNVEDGGGVVDDRFSFNAVVNGRDFWESYMPAFDACVSEAKAMHVMCSYNSVNGVPACGNTGLLTTVLRNKFSFEGFVVSDYDAWAFIYDRHQYTKSMEDAAALGINSGLDQEGGGNAAIDELHAAVNHSKTTPSAIEKAFRRLFRARIRLGMFDLRLVKYYDLFYNSTELANNEAHRAVNQRAARESITLLKNGNETLPLNARNVNSAALIGFQGNIAGLLSGNYAGSANSNNWGKSFHQALKDKVSGVHQVNACENVRCLNANASGAFDEAKAAAKKSDVTFILLGLAFDSYCSDPSGQAPPSENNYCESEMRDRTEIELPSGQREMLLQTGAASSNSVVCILIHGGAIALDAEMLSACDAIVDAFYPGPEGASATLDAVFGIFSPAGRLPVTFYQSTEALGKFGTISLYENSTSGYPGITYRYYKKPVLFPFGFGLSYTTFQYQAMKAPQSASVCDTIQVDVTLKNTGSVDSDEVVQCYVRHLNASVAVPNIRLAAFERVSVAAGSQTTVTLSILPKDRAVVLDGGAAAEGEDVYTADIFHVVEGDSAILISCGGGQPAFYKGALQKRTQIKGRKVPLSSCNGII